MGLKFTHTKDGLTMVSSEATLAKFSAQRGYEFKTEVNSIFESFKSGKVTLDLSQDISLTSGEIDLKIEWNEVNNNGAKLAYYVKHLLFCKEIN